MSDIVIQAGGGVSLVERLALSSLRRSSQILQPSHFKGYGRIASQLRKVAPQRHIVLKLDADSLFRFPFGDAYWSRLSAHANTRFVSGVLVMPVFAYDGRRFNEASDPLAAMSVMKTNSRRGYNVLATNSSEWLALLRSA